MKFYTPILHITGKHALQDVFVDVMIVGGGTLYSPQLSDPENRCLT